MKDDFAAGGSADRSGAARRTGARPSVRRVETAISSSQTVSALIWGAGDPEIVLLHGGGQNSHTWDSVIPLVGRPAIGVDLPGHGHSTWRPDRDYRPAPNAHAVAEVLMTHAPSARSLVGMSLGGLTGISLAHNYPQLVENLTIVDALPRAIASRRNLSRQELGAVALIDGPRVFDSREEMVTNAVQASPSRPPEATRRGVYRNAVQRPDGRWQWRYDSLDNLDAFDAASADLLWSELSELSCRVQLVRAGDSPFISDEEAERYRAARPTDRITLIGNSGHSVQGDQPHQLARLINEFLPS